jgi:hypothetical protein
MENRTMADIQVIIQRPVAFPDKFLGAPVLPSMMAFCVCGLGMLIMFIFKSYGIWGGLFFMLVWPFAHGAIMIMGIREPHMSTLMQTWYLTTIAPRNLGRKGKSHRVFHPA